MPTNLPQQYYKIEERFKAARDPDEKIAHLREMMAVMPRHKGTDKLWADLRRRLSALQDESEKQKKSRAGRPNPFFIPHSEAPQVLIVGAPNCGKSSLLAAVTNAHPEVADYPFTTTLPQPGMMPWRDVQVELIDTPPVLHKPFEPWLLDQARAADAVLALVDLSAPDCCEVLDLILAGFEERGLRLIGADEKSDPDRAFNEKRMLLGASKCDHSDAGVNLEFLDELYPDSWPRHTFSTRSGEGVEELRDTIFAMLRLIRVYTRVPGKKAEMDAPYLLPAGSTPLELARKVHRDFVDRFDSARVWGSSKFDGQVVDREHVLEDEDIVEIHLKHG